VVGGVIDFAGDPDHDTDTGISTWNFYYSCIWQEFCW